MKKSATQSLKHTVSQSDPNAELDVKRQKVSGPSLCGGWTSHVGLLKVLSQVSKDWPLSCWDTESNWPKCTVYENPHVLVHTAGEQVNQRWNHKFSLRCPPVLTESIVNEDFNVL